MGGGCNPFFASNHLVCLSLLLYNSVMNYNCISLLMLSHCVLMHTSILGVWPLAKDTTPLLQIPGSTPDSAGIAS